MDGIFGQSSIKFSSMIYSSKYVDSILNDRENRNREKCDHCVNVKVAFLCFSTTFSYFCWNSIESVFFLATDECEDSRLLVEALDVSSKLYISSTDLCAKAQTTQFPRLETIINSKHVEIV